MGHGACYLVTTGDDGVVYWAHCKRYSDAHETSFKAQVRRLAGRHGHVRRENFEPAQGTELTFN